MRHELLQGSMLEYDFYRDLERRFNIDLEQEVEDWLERKGIRTHAFPSVEAGLEAVASGELTAAVYDAPILRHLAVSEFEGRIQVLPFLLDHQNYAFGLKPESALRKPLNRALLHETESISWSALLQRYLGAPGA